MTRPTELEAIFSAELVLFFETTYVADESEITNDRNLQLNYTCGNSCEQLPLCLASCN